jgi:hypothetical protein
MGAMKMSDHFDRALKILEGFEILPPEFTNAVNDTLEFDPAPARNPVKVHYPGLKEEIPGLERVTVGCYGDNWGAGRSPAAPQREETLEGYAPGAVLTEAASYRIWAVVRFKMAGEETELIVRSADRTYKLKRKEAK